MIKSFRCRQTSGIFRGEGSRKIPQGIQRVAMRKLWMLDAAIDLNDLAIPPGNRLEALKGDRLGWYSIRINRQYRICFQWHGHCAYNVEIIDYHEG